MYYHIKGILEKKDNNFVVIESGGIGYLIYTSLSSLNSIGSLGNSVKMYTHLNVREDAMELYGFTTLEEKEMFIKLISVSGVGPKVALSILSVTSPEKFAVAVITNDVKTITKAQGVGPKMAQRVILELKDKLKNEDLDISCDVSHSSDDENAKNEAVSALVVLGYSPDMAKKAVSKTEDGLSTEEIIKKALALLMM